MLIIIIIIIIIIVIIIIIIIIIIRMQTLWIYTYNKERNDAMVGFYLQSARLKFSALQWSRSVCLLIEQWFMFSGFLPWDAEI